MDDETWMAEKTRFYCKNRYSITHKTLRNQTAAKEKGDWRWRDRPRAHGDHHGPWSPPWPANGGNYPRMTCFPRVASSSIILTRGTSPCLCVLGVFRPLLLSSLIHKASKIIFYSDVFELAKLNSVNILETQEKLKSNRRKRSINRTINHFNPLK